MSSELAELELEVGGLPDGWCSLRLGDVADISRGTSWSSDNERRDPVDGALPVLGIRNVQARLEIDDLLWLYGLKPSAIASSTVQTGDILMVGSNGNPARIGNAVQVDEPGRYLYASLLFGLRALRDAVDPDFLYQAIVAPGVQSAISDAVQGTTGLSNLKITTLRDLPIDLPPLNEQQRIAEVLRSVDEAIAASEIALASCRELVSKLARDVTESCEGTTTMASLGKIVTGRTPSPKQAELWGGDLPFVTPGDLVAGNISVSDASRTLVADSGHGATVLPANSILVTCIGSTVGKTAIARKRCVTNQQINVICCPAQIAGFTYLACVAAYDTIVANAGKQAVPIINKSTFSAIEVPALSQAEMIEISTMVDAIDSEIVAAQTSLETLHRTKATLMSDLLSGRVRVSA